MYHDWVNQLFARLEYLLFYSVLFYSKDILFHFLLFYLYCALCFFSLYCSLSVRIFGPSLLFPRRLPVERCPQGEKNAIFFYFSSPRFSPLDWEHFA